MFSSSAIAEKILHIGDSHTAGNYGSELSRLLTAAGNTVETYGCVGVTASEYLTGSKCERKLDDSLAILSPDSVIISLGTNYLNGPAVQRDRDNIEKILVLAAAKRCYWVGAPKSAQNNVFPVDINRELRDILRDRCTFIDATVYTDMNKLASGSQVHYGPEGGAEWARGVFSVIIGQTPVQPSAAQPSGQQITPGSTTAGTEDKTISEPSAVLTSTRKASIPGCRNTQTCIEIDEVWKVLSAKLKTWPGYVWDPSVAKFVDFDEYYYEKKAAPAAVYDTAQIDPIIKEAASLQKADPALIKAIMKHESSFNPKAVSSTGCKGLLQVCSWSGNYASFKKKYPDINLLDDPFDIRSNTYVGIHVLQSKLKTLEGSCKKGDDELKCFIASFNAGEGFVSGTAAEVGKPASWEAILNKAQDENFIKRWYTDTRTWTGPKGQIQRWTDTVTCSALGGEQVSRRRCKFAGLGSYVNKIFNDYSAFKKDFP